LLKETEILVTTTKKNKKTKTKKVTPKLNKKGKKMWG
jgi:hypothetical protein